jgi:hypothetical protein
MARPLKQGLDYFSLDVDIDQDDKVQLVEALHGIKGFGMLIKLLMRIYREGYYYKWTETEQILFSKRVNVDINVVIDVVNDCIKYEIFNKNLFEKYKILTSHGIQKRYFEASTRRKNIDIVVEYLLITVNKEVNVSKNNVNVNKNPASSVVNEHISTERKGKETERKGKYGDFVTLQKSEYEKLVAEYGEQGALEIIKILDNYKGSSGKKYKSDYRAILTWVVKRFKEDQQKQPVATKPTTIYKPFVFDPSRGEE